MYGNYRGYKAPIEEAERIIAERGGRQKKASALMLAPHAIAGGLGYAGGEEGRRKLRGAGLSEDAISGGGINALGGMGRHLGYGAGGTALGALAGGALGGDVGALTGGLAGNAIGGLYGMYRGYKAPIEEAERIIAERGGRQKKAHFKLAEDAINPARISAGPAPAFSGEIMPAASPVFGGQTDPSQLIAMKAQKVRDRINADMRAYVSETGEGYNLDGHLSIFNK
jgi:hypothetical protein